MTAPVLRLDRVVVRAGTQTLLDVPGFAVEAGETVAVIGPNGAGKTTLLHVAALLRRPDAGTVTILGETATQQNAAMLRRAFSVVFQAPLLFDVGVLANAAAGLRFHGCPREESRRRAGAWLERFGVGQLSERRARGLSGGEASRVTLARAFATEPAILLLDEPFRALDAPTRASLLPTLRQRLRETGAAAVLVTHDLDEAFTFGDRVAVMERGRIVASGNAPGLIARPPSREVAQLLGIETILSATVTHIDGECASLALQPGGPLVRARTLLADGLVAGQTVTVTLPAGAVRVVVPTENLPPGWNVLPGTVAAAASRSSSTRLVVETPAPIVGLAAWDHSHRRWAAGDCAIVTFPPEAAHLIPHDG